MLSMMAYVGRDYEPALRWGYYVGIAIVLAAVVFLRPKPVPAPSRSLVFGCYKSTQGPAIALNVHGLQVEQPGFPLIGFHLERLKTGIALTTEAPIDAGLKGGKYQFFMDRRGQGIFLNFVRDIDGNRYGVFDDNKLSQFAMITQDGELLYSRIAEDC